MRKNPRKYDDSYHIIGDGERLSMYLKRASPHIDMVVLKQRKYLQWSFIS
jgi:hypothetical protein